MSTVKVQFAQVEPAPPPSADQLRIGGTPPPAQRIRVAAVGDEITQIQFYRPIDEPVAINDEYDVVVRPVNGLHRVLSDVDGAAS